MGAGHTRANALEEMRLPMYDVQSTTVALGSAYVRGTKYDVRFGEFPRLRANLAKQARELNCGATGGGGYKGAGGGGAWQCLCTTYEVRCTIYKVPALAREFSGASDKAKLRNNAWT